MPSTNPVFFDTDGVSAFLWVNEESLLCKLYPGRIVIPVPVYIELSNPCIRHLKRRIDLLVNNNLATLRKLDVGTNEYSLYREMTISPRKGHAIIGNGEAAAIALAVQCGGIVASNNLRDVKSYVAEYDLRLFTTGDILKEALKRGIIDENAGNGIWSQMLSKKRKLGYGSFSQFLAQN